MNKNTNFYHFQQCKPFLIESIDSILSVHCEKERLHPCEQRNQYSLLIQWMLQRFSNLKKRSENQQQLSIYEIMNQQKKIVISSFIQMGQLLSKQCQQKGAILKIIMEYTLQTINTLVKSLEKITTQQFLQMLASNQKIEAQSVQRIKFLQAQNLIYKKQKDHRWKNMFMVVKDNRVLKKQKMKLIKKLKQEHWNIKYLNEEILNLRGQNQKYKLILSSEDNKQKLNSYLNSKLKITQMEKRIAEYPKHAKRILMKQLQKIQTNQFNTLDQKIEYIIKAIDLAGEVVDVEDDFDQVKTNQRMYYNAFVQTQIQLAQFATNTVDVKSIQCFTQVPLSTLSKKFCLESAVINENGYHFRIQLPKLKGKTMALVNYEMQKCLQSKKNKNCISNLQALANYCPNQNQNEQKTRINSNDENVFVKVNKFQTTFNKLLQEQQNIKSRQNYESSVKFKIEDDNKQYHERVQVTRGYFKRGSFLANVHTVSSKQKLTHVLRQAPKQWKIKKMFNIAVNKNNQNQTETQNSHPAFILLNRQSQEDLNLRLRNRSNSASSASSSINQQTIQQLAASRKISNRNSRKSIHPTHLSELQRMKTISPNNLKNNLPIKSSKEIFKIKDQTNILANNTTNDYPKRDSQSSSQSMITDQNQHNKNKMKKNASPNLNKISKKDFILKRKNYRQSQNSQLLKGVQSNFNKSKAKQNRMASFSNSSTGFYNAFNKAKDNSKRQSKNSLLLSDKSNNISIKKQHFRTMTQEVEQIQQMSQELQNKFAPTQKQIQRKNSIKTSQSASQMLKPMRRMATQIVNKVELFQKIQKLKIKQKVPLLSQIDLLKSIQKIIKNISQRAIQIFKNKYTLKQFLVTYYQQNYGDSMRSTHHFLIQMSNRKYYNQTIVQAFSVLMNTQANQKYLQDMFKVFATIIQRNGGILSKNLGQAHNKQVFRFVLGWFFDQEKIDSIIKDLCIQLLNGNIIDYFIAIEAEIKKNTLNTKLYKFLKGFILPSQSTIFYDLIKQISFCLKDNQNLGTNIKSKNKMLLNLKVLTQQSIELHRLPLIIDRINWSQFHKLPQYVQQKYLQTFGSFSQQEVINQCSKSKSFLINFPILKQIFDKVVQNYYTHNIQIRRQFLMLCKLILIEFQVQKQLLSQVPNTLKLMKQRYDILENKQFYDKLISQI